jgi:hypothetical protein
MYKSDTWCGGNFTAGIVISKQSTPMHRKISMILTSSRRRITRGALNTAAFMAVLSTFFRYQLNKEFDFWERRVYEISERKSEELN